jgi:hypothetical protein
MFSTILLAPFQLSAPHHQHWDNEEKEKLTSTKKKSEDSASLSESQPRSIGAVVNLPSMG